jgi:hypothetical protein
MPGDLNKQIGNKALEGRTLRIPQRFTNRCETLKLAGQTLFKGNGKSRKCYTCFDSHGFWQYKKVATYVKLAQRLRLEHCGTVRRSTKQIFEVW